MLFCFVFDSFFNFVCSVPICFKFGKISKKIKKCSYKFSKIDRKIPVSEQVWNFIKKEPPAQIFFCDFCNLFRTPFLRSFPEAFSIVITWNPNRFWIFHFSNFSFFSFLSIRPVYQQRRQLAVRFYSKCCIMRSRVGVLVARQSRLAMTVVVEL